MISKWITASTIQDTLVEMYEEDLRIYVLKLMECERDPKLVRKSPTTLKRIKKNINFTVHELNRLTNSNTYDMFLQNQQPEMDQEAVPNRINTIDPLKMDEDFRNLDKFINDLKGGIDNAKKIKFSR